MRVSEIRVKRIRVNQGLGVIPFSVDFFLTYNPIATFRNLELNVQIFSELEIFPS